MQHSSRVAILLVLVTVAIFAWVPKGKKTKGVSSTTSSVTFGKAIRLSKAVPRKRTEFVDWGRNPFAWPRGEESVSSVSSLALFCIILNDEEALALINESVVRVGDKITDKTVKQIEPNKVILTNGTKDYVLELRE